MDLKKWIIDGLALLFAVAVMVGAYSAWRVFDRGMGAALGL